MSAGDDIGQGVGAPHADGGTTRLYAGVVDRPVAVAMVFLAAVVFGFVAYARLRVELMPDISYPTITVRTAFEGAAPQEVETQVSQPVEENLATLDGLVTLESRSRAGTSDVLLGFDWGTDMPTAAQAIREALQTTFLPDVAERPLILRYDPSLEPFLRLGLSVDPTAVDLSPDAQLFLLREVADKDLRKALESMQGVAAVRVRGGLEREVRIAVRDEWLVARGVTLEDVRTLLAQENVNVAGGEVLEGDTAYLVRTVAEFQGVDDLRALQLRRSDGVLVPLTDVAEIIDTHAERQVVTHLNGSEAVELELLKEADANVVDVAQRVRGLLDGADVGYDQATVDALPPGDQRDAMQEALDGAKGLADRLPTGVTLVVLDDQAQFIELAITNVRDSVLLGGLFAVLVLYLFLRDFRATAIIGVSIPISLLVAFGPLYIGAITLNLMTLGGLALGVGMLVDNSVVVLEAIQRWIDEGIDRRTAAIRGTSEVAAAVFASTLTTVAVFVPITLVEGVGGQLFGDLAQAVVWSLMASLAVALFLVPMLAARELSLDALSPVADAPRRAWLASVREDWARDRAWVAERAWRRLLWPYLAVRTLLAALFLGGLALGTATLMASVWVTTAVLGVVAFLGGNVMSLAAAVFQWAYAPLAALYGDVLRRVISRPGTILGGAIVALVLALGALRDRGTELVPEVHQGRFTIDASLPVGTPLARTVDAVTAAERVIGAHPDVAVVYATIGVDSRDEARSDEGEHSARIRVQLTPGGDIAAREARVMDELRATLAGTGGLATRFSRPALFSFRTPMEVVIHGEDLDALQRSGDAVVATLDALPSLADVETSQHPGSPEVQIRYDRTRLARLGLDTATVADRVRDRIQGVVATELHGGTDRVDLRVQLSADQRASVADLGQLNVNPSVTPPIPLYAVASLATGVGPSEIRRVDQQRAVVVSAGLVGFDMGGAITDVQAAMRRVSLEGDQHWTLGGQARELSGAGGSLLLALALAVFLVYVVMASTFENLGHPLVILLTVPLAAIGVALGLGVAGLPLSIPAFMGIIVLAGVVVNNAIVLVDATNQLRADGHGRVDAIVTAGRLRLRPILITTVTTVLGLLPLCLGLGAGAEIQQPLAVTVVGGLSIATLLTLVVIPTVYLLVTRDAPDPTP